MLAVGFWAGPRGHGEHVMGQVADGPQRPTIGDQIEKERAAEMADGFGLVYSMQL